MNIAIIGAGLAGLTAAHTLREAGRAVRVYEKSGGLGGRIATRRSEGAAFDHGAPLLHGFEPPGAVRWRDGWVGRPGNSAIGRTLGAGLEIRSGARVVGLNRVAGRWRVRCAAGDTVGSGDAEGFDAVLLAIPAPQALALLGDRADAFAGLADAKMRPGWTVMATFDAPVRGPDWRPALAAPLGLALRNSAKPDRPAGEAWVIHADDVFAQIELESAAGCVAARLIAAFRDATGAAAPSHVTAHRWRFARVARPLGAPCLWDEGAGLGLAGDWCLGPDAGDAVASGRAVSRAVLAGT